MTKQQRSPVHNAQKLREQAERGRRAEELMADPMMIEAFDTLDKMIETGWKDSSGMDREARENAYHLHRAVAWLRGHFQTILVRGQNARSLIKLEEIDGGGGQQANHSKPG